MFKSKLQVKVLMFVCAVLSFTAVDVYSINVSSYTGLASALQSQQTPITFTTSIITYTNDISWTFYDVAFDGNGVTLDGANNYRIFRGSGGILPRTASFYGNIKFINGNVSGSGGEGGAIYNYASMTFSNGSVDFSGNNSIYLFVSFTSNGGGNGGAIFNNIGSITFTNSIITFSANYATGGYSGASGLYTNGYGGAIYNAAGSTITFTKSTATFSGNGARSGGAIYNGGIITFDGSAQFQNNIAAGGGGGQGGAIYNVGTLNLTSNNGNITFSNNTANGISNDIHNQGGTININGTSNDVTINSGISGTGNINKLNNGRLLINGNSSNYTGTYTQSAGNTIVSNNTFNTTHTITGGTLTFATGTGLSANTAVSLGTGGTLSITGSDTLSFGASFLSGTGTLNKSGTGTLNITGNNSGYAGTYTQSAGNTVVSNNTFNTTHTITGGTLTFAMGAGLSANTAVSLGAGGTLSITGSDTLSFGTSFLRGSGTLNKSGTGTLNITGNNSGYAGTYTQSAGNTVVSSNTFNSTHTVTGGTLRFDNGTILSANTKVELGAGGNLEITGNDTLNFGASFLSGSGTLNKSGTGQLNITDNNSAYTGTYTQEDGTTTVSGNYFGGISNITGGLLELNTGTVLSAGSSIVVGNAGEIKITGADRLVSDGNISGLGKVIKSGSGELVFRGVNEIAGIFEAEAGIVTFETGSSGKSEYRGGTFKGSGAIINMQNGSAEDVIEVGTFESLSGLKIDVTDNGKYDRIIAETAKIDGSIDILAGVGTYNNIEYDLIATNGTKSLSGEFADSFISDEDLRYDIGYENGIVKLSINGKVWTNFKGLDSLTYNQKETARVFDKISQSPGDWGLILTEMKNKQKSGEIEEVKDFLSETSGYFLANVIRNMAADSPNNEVYDKIRNHTEGYETNSGLWVQLKGGIESFKSDENSSEDYRDISMGVMFGFDKFLSYKLADGDVMWGVYGRINKDNIEQGKHKADGNKNGLGLYGGYIRDGWELKAMLLGSYDKFSTERAVMGHTAKADINAVTVSADMEAALRIALTEEVKLKPYFGMELENTMYGGFKERGADIYNLDVKDGSYLRSAARIGAGVDYEKDIWIWYANIEGKYMIEGAKSEIRSGFDGIEEEFNSRGAEEGKMQIGIGAGAEIEVALNWKIFANAKYYTGERYENLYGNAGVRYMFGNKKRLPNEDAEKQYNKAQKLYNKGEYLRATDMLSEMIVTNPGFEPPKRLHTKIQDEMNKTAASREEADFSKVAYAKGYCAYYETEYNTAIKEWGKYIEFAGVNNEISEYMKKVNNMINLKKLIEREAEIDAKAEEMLNAGIEKYNASKWVACIKDMEALQKFVTENKFSRTEEYYNKAKEYITLSANELAKAMKTEKKATSKPKEPEPQAVEEKQPEIDEAEADKKYNEGLVLYAQGKYLEAERTWELTLRLNPNHQKAKTALSKMRSKDN